MDIKLDVDGHVSFVNGESQVTEIGAEDLAQRIQVRLRTFKGEWFMDNTVGVDWWGKVFGKNRSKSSVDAIIQTEILKETDALQIINYNSSIVNRMFSCTFKVRTTNGAVSAPVTFNIAAPV